MIKRREPGNLWAIATIALAFGLVLAPPSVSIFGAPLKDHPERISPALLRELELLGNRPEYYYRIPIIVQGREEFFVKSLPSVKSLIPLDLVNGYSASLSPQQIRQMLQSDDVEYITVDAVIRAAQQFSPLKGFESTIGVDQVSRRGSGIVLALLDSGIQRDPSQAASILAMDFTSGEETDVSGEPGIHDGYGHGTHLAGIVGGLDEGGLSDQAKIIDLKVIGDEGWGYTSNLIRAIQWVTENHSKYKIRVANLSLGHPPVESYANDPLCQAVAKMVNAGVVTVVSAGNLGKTPKHSKIWGGITSPGTEPSVITVGAVNTRGTPTHHDDVATTYGSRGPTIDGLFKPDLVAPANLIPSAMVPGSWLAQELPENIVAGEYMALSGSSVATAFVSNAVGGSCTSTRD